MAASKTKEHDDIEFSRDALVSDDLRVSDEEREKRNKPMPEEYRDNPEKLDGWPVPEDRLPAVMRADQKDSNDYKLATYKEVDDKDRDLELTAGSGAVARREFRKLLAEAGPTADMNKIQAPPTPAAEAAAEGEGAETDVVPIVNRSGQQVNGPLGVQAASAAAVTASSGKSGGKDSK
jgi:hypothetical protein